MSAPQYTTEELIAVVLSRSFADGEVGFTGLATGGAAALYITGIPLAAMEPARRLVDQSGLFRDPRTAVRRI